LLIGLSVTKTSAPVDLHCLTTSARTSGDVVAPRCDGRSNAQFGFIRTVSLAFTKRPIPPISSSAAATSLAPSSPRAITISLFAASTEKSLPGEKSKEQKKEFNIENTIPAHAASADEPKIFPKNFRLVIFFVLSSIYFLKDIS